LTTSLTNFCSPVYSSRIPILGICEVLWIFEARFAAIEYLPHELEIIYFHIYGVPLFEYNMLQEHFAFHIRYSIDSIMCLGVAAPAEKYLKKSQNNIQKLLTKCIWWMHLFCHQMSLQAFNEGENMRQYK